MGDNISIAGSVIGSVVGSGILNARDITVYTDAVNNSKLDAGTKKILLAARHEVENSDLNATTKGDVNDSIGKLTAELEKKNKEPGMILRYFNRIKDAAVGVALTLSSIVAIKDAIEGFAK